MFQCAVTCAEVCCTGATMLTLDEVGTLYRHFPITVGFRQYSPVDSSHRDFLDTVAERAGDVYIMGDFIAGNWRRKRCAMLSSARLCSLHNTGLKPIQCRIVPFCAVYPENRQHAVLAEQQMGAFRKCRGFQQGTRKNREVWSNGIITDTETRQAFYGYRENLGRQRRFMQAILDECKALPAFQRFLAGKGILEAPIPASMLSELLSEAGVPEDDHQHYLRFQAELCLRELGSRTPSLVFQDALQQLKQLMNTGEPLLGKENIITKQ